MKRCTRTFGPMGLLGLGLLIVAVGIWASNGTSAAQGTAVSLRPESQVVELGDTVSVDFYAENVINLGAFEFRISYDPDILSLEGVVEGDLMRSTGRNVTCQRATVNPEDLLPGHLWFGCETMRTPGGPPPPSGSGVLATMTFKAIGGGTTALIFDGRPPALSDDFSDDCCGSLEMRQAVVQVLEPDEPTPKASPAAPPVNPSALTPTPNPAAPTPSSAFILQPADSQSGGASGAGAYSSGGAGAGDGIQSKTSGSPRAGTGPREDGAPIWGTLAGCLLAAAGASLLLVAFGIRRAEETPHIRRQR